MWAIAKAFEHGMNVEEVHELTSSSFWMITFLKGPASFRFCSSRVIIIVVGAYAWVLVFSCFSTWTEVLTAGSFRSFMVCTWSKARWSPWTSISFATSQSCWRRPSCADSRIVRSLPWCQSLKRWSTSLRRHFFRLTTAPCATQEVLWVKHTFVTCARSLASYRWWSRLTRWRLSTQQRQTICTSPTLVKSMMSTWRAVRSNAQMSKSPTWHLPFRSPWRWSSRALTPKKRPNRASSFWAAALTGLEAAWSLTGAVCPASVLSGLWDTRQSSSTAIPPLGPKLHQGSIQICLLDYLYIYIYTHISSYVFPFSQSACVHLFGLGSIRLKPFWSLIFQLGNSNGCHACAMAVPCLGNGVHRLRRVEPLVLWRTESRACHGHLWVGDAAWGGGVRWWPDTQQLGLGLAQVGKTMEKHGKIEATPLDYSWPNFTSEISRLASRFWCGQEEQIVRDHV